MPDRPTALRDLQLADARWRAVLATARDAIICIDAEGLVTLFNPAAEDVFGYRAAEVLGRNVNMLMPPPYHDEHDEYLRHYQTTGEARAIGRIRNVHAQRKNGEIFPIELSVSESRLGDEVLYTAIIRDVGERLAERVELRKLQHLDQERERLADIGAITAKIVHDLGNPLAALSMQAQLILRRARHRDAVPAAKVREPAEQILTTLRRLEGLVHEFTDFAREQRLEIRPIDVERLLQSCVELWRPLAAERGVRLELGALTAIPILQGDDVMLRRVLDNLIKNAIEAIDNAGGHVLVSAEVLTADKIRIAVDDSGTGVPEGVDVFKLFETTKPSGTGIGLAVARQIVLAHGGNIGHTRRAPTGARFHLELPIRGPAKHDT
jgi:two-component system sensor kinase FixL